MCPAISQRSEVSPEELGLIARQLGREPRGLLQVERYCLAGHPQVIRVYPLIENKAGLLEPFPTIFWLSCPRLVRQIAKLEHQGLIRKLEELFRSDVRLRARYASDQRAYQLERWSSLNQRDKERVRRDPRWWAAFWERGIGGLGDLERVKCLHLHYAHHLARRNVIGEWITAHYPIEPCAGQVQG
ncbi:MAG TPA: DUF501 domain-containing protein [Candidatus Fraserbacteria bacterium]|nr:DUF501 domain-containing protein [Candidatus Fraserbacteria bacterium]